MPRERTKFVSRAGEKLEAALDAFGLDVHGAVCADFGCNVGGFTDCLLSRGASKVYAIDTGYGELAWKLRKDPRVAVMERTNALYVDPPELVNLVVIDMAWTVQHLAVPAATRWLKQNDPVRPARIVALLKTHYELTKSGGSKPLNVLPQAQSDAVCAGVCETLGKMGHPVRAVMRSVLQGKGGNTEYLLLLGGEAEFQSSSTNG